MDKVYEGGRGGAQFNDFVIGGFYKSKTAQKSNNSAFFAIENYGGCRWIGNKFLHQFDLLKFEIGLLEAEKVKFV